MRYWTKYEFSLTTVLLLLALWSPLHSLAENRHPGEGKRWENTSCETFPVGNESTTSKKESYARMPAISGDGSILATLSSKGAWSIVEAHTHKELKSGTLELPSDDWGDRIFLSHDGKLALATSQRGLVKIFEVASGREILSAQHLEKIVAADFSKDGRFAATGGYHEGTKVYDLKAGKELYFV